MTARDVTAAVEAALDDPEGAPRWLIEIVFDSGTTRLWNGLGDLSALGQTWVGAGRLLSMAPIQETQQTVANGVRMELLIVPTTENPDAPDAFLNIALTEEYQGRPVTIYQAQLDPGTLALIDDPFVRFKGRLDVMQDSEMPGAALLRVTAESRLIDLERARRRTYTPEDHKAVYPDDTFYDEVAAMQGREIVLG